MNRRERRCLRAVGRSARYRFERAEAARLIAARNDHMAHMGRLLAEARLLAETPHAETAESWAHPTQTDDARADLQTAIAQVLEGART